MHAPIAALAMTMLAALPAWASDVTTFTLPNGMQGVVIEDHRAPVVTHMVWYRVGAADDPPGQSGLAHFLEHLMFKATAELEDGEFSRLVRENGGEDNAFTSSDYTAYFQRIAADRLEMVMAMEAERMVNLAPGAAAVLAERDVVSEERRQVVENSPDGPFGELRRATMYLNHPYGRPVIGWAHEIAALDEAGAMDFYRKHYAPNNAILVVAGDVDPAEVERLALAHFGPIPASEAIVPRVRAQEPPHLGARRFELRDERVRRPYVARSYLAPPRRPGDQREAAALRLLADLLGGSGITSVIGQRLQIEEEIALGGGASYSDLGLDQQIFALHVTPKPEVDLAEAEARLDALIAQFLEDGPDPAQLERVRRRVRAAEIFALDSQMGRARRIGAGLTSGLTLEDIEAWPAVLQSVTPDEILAAARAVLRPESSVTGWMLGTEDAPATGGLGQ